MTVNEIITERIIEKLKQGVAPWQQPWKVKELMPRNLVSGKPYRGINILLLHMAHYSSPLWLTFKQAGEMGGRIKKGERAMPVIFWKKTELMDPETGEAKTSFVLRYYSLFNVAQVEGISAQANEPATVEPPTPAEQIIAGMPNRPEIKFGFARCSYSVGSDEVRMVDKAHFENEADFFSTVFHELTHSTGHASRLGRLVKKEHSFGDEEYSKEELVAEIGASFLCGEAGIFNRTVNSSAAYLQSWLEALTNDATMIVSAAAQAQKAADYILNRKPEAEA